MSAGQDLAPLQSLIGSRIVVLREQRVMLDSDLAELYCVETRILVQAVKRNLDRIPNDFMFQWTIQDLAALRSQTVISNIGRGGRRTAPYAFTEQGVAMLSSVLNSPCAIVVNIEIMRTFVRVRELAATHGDLAGADMGFVDDEDAQHGRISTQEACRCILIAGRRHRGGSRVAA